MRGALVGITAGRRAVEQAALVETLGGRALCGSTVGPDRPRTYAQVAQALGAALSARPQIVIAITGVAVHHLVDAAAQAGMEAALRDALAGAEVVARGPKARAALRRHGVEPTWTADPATSAAVADRLLARGVGGRRTMVVAAEGDAAGLCGRLATGGASVAEVASYALDGPAHGEDGRRLVDLAIAGQIDAVTFTSSRAAHGFAALMEQRGGRPPTGVAIAAVGPLTAATLRRRGIAVAVEPATARMGAMYQALRLHLGQR